ncbi:hypothetical protein AC579_1278 [Pseudocercospora musae]|uniref:Uncharacterized protein n=1 Tax=Pseudocercospora musae TaxID=113226 RepID=A0A139IHU6_9PEZI|nr:hypothetical protein AC579_1278 [Pseudocercospora musae]
MHASEHTCYITTRMIFDSLDLLDSGGSCTVLIYMQSRLRRYKQIGALVSESTISHSSPQLRPRLHPAMGAFIALDAFDSIAKKSFVDRHHEEQGGRHSAHGRDSGCCKKRHSTSVSSKRLGSTARRSVSRLADLFVDILSVDAMAATEPRSM